jgi:hypothetical protein
MATAAGQNQAELSFGLFNVLASERLLIRDDASAQLGARAFEFRIALISAPNAVVNKKRADIANFARRNSRGRQPALSHGRPRKARPASLHHVQHLVQCARSTTNRRASALVREGTQSLKSAN